MFGLGVLPGSLGRQPPPREARADSGRQGPFPSAGGSYHQFSPRKTLLWDLRSGLTSSILRLPQGWEGTKLGGVTSRHFLARGRVSLGSMEWREKRVPWALARGDQILSPLMAVPEGPPRPCLSLWLSL